MPSFLCVHASPAGRIAPASISASAFSRLILDHTLFAPRGVNFWSHEASSPRCFWPSIQPHASATSIASAYVIDAVPDTFLARLSQMPREEA